MKEVAYMQISIFFIYLKQSIVARSIINYYQALQFTKSIRWFCLLLCAIPIHECWI